MDERKMFFLRNWTDKDENIKWHLINFTVNSQYGLLNNGTMNLILWKEAAAGYNAAEMTQFKDIAIAMNGWAQAV